MTQNSPSEELTLFDIESGISGLVNERDECETDAEREQVDQAIAAYIAAEITKVDGIRSYMLHCQIMSAAAQEEAERQRVRAKQWEARAANLKAMCLRVLQSAGKKKVEGRTGALMVKGNGGLAPLNVTDESMIPEECCVYAGKIAGPLWLRTVVVCPWLEQPFAGEAVKMERQVVNGLVRDSLKVGPVAGAFLGDRESHLEIK